MSVLIPTDFRHGWAIFFLPSGGQKHLNGSVIRAPSQWKVFRTFFCTCCEISVWNLAYTCSGWCHTSSSSFIPIWTLWPTLQPKIGQSHLSAFMALKKLYRGLRFGTHTQIVSVLTPIDFCHPWAIFGPLVDKKNLEFSGLFSKCCAVSTWKLVYTLSRLHNILSSCFTRMGSLWPSCS